MTHEEVLLTLARQFSKHFGRGHTVAAYSPGRVEVLGNHTDYNEGFVLSAAINLGTHFLAAPSPDSQCRLVAGDLMEEVRFDIASRSPSPTRNWSNYVKGVSVNLRERHKAKTGFWGMFLGDLPLGAGLSSSAALETASGLALSSLYGIDVPKLELAKIGQSAEHDFAGVKCGLLDQISCLFGCENHLVMSDFRTLAVETVPLGAEACFLMCNTNVKHSLVDSQYNERRAKCEEAARFFASVLGHPVAALRDVTWKEWQDHSSRMDPVAARRAAHVIGENTRVLRGRDLLNHGDLDGFGKLMSESHQSSVANFENSCRQLDFLVSAARRIPGVLGARLSGGGFGGSVVVLLHPRDADAVGRTVAAAYKKEFDHPCDARVVTPSAGAHVIVV